MLWGGGALLKLVSIKQTVAVEDWRQLTPATVDGCKRLEGKIDESFAGLSSLLTSP